MKRELKEKWVAALRSGEYPQGQKYLRAGSERKTYCCLGVLCDIAGPNGWQAETVHVLGDGLGFLNCNTRDKLGITQEDMFSLVNMNDADPPKSFSEIADWIEENIPAED